MTRRELLLALVLFLLVLCAIGCKRPEVIRTVQVKVPVPVPCPPPARLERPKAPAELKDAAAPPDVKAKALLAWVYLVQSYASQLELQLEAYRPTPAPQEPASASR